MDNDLHRESSWPPLVTASKFADLLTETWAPARQTAAEECAAREENLAWRAIVENMPMRECMEGPMIGRIPSPERIRKAQSMTVEYSDGRKDTNPKDGIGATKLPLSLVPATATALASLAHLDGALKYGKWNWRIAGVRASIYVDAAKRHLDKWFNGEEFDQDSGLPHFAHALACINILVDSQACGKLDDDRPPSVDINLWFDQLTPYVAELKEKHAGKSPYHYTIEDTEA